MNRRNLIRFILALITLIVLALGWKFQVLGWVVPAAMITGILGALIFGNRFVCGNVCPRGAFLDVFISKISKKRNPSKYMRHSLLKVIVLIALFGFFFFSLFTMRTYNELPLIFWKMCLYTTLIGIFLSFFINERAWCMICPIGSIGGWLRKKKNALYIDPGKCIDCKKCDRSCPVKILPSSFKGRSIDHSNCIFCKECKRVCPKNAIQ